MHICEGDSALGGMLPARDSRTQAVLPIRGKILNVSRLDDLSNALKNEEIRSIVNSIGAGIGDSADSVSYYYDEDDGDKMFHMTPLDDLTMASFPGMCYFILRHEEMDKNDTFVHVIWHKNGDYHVVVKAMDEIDIPNIETKTLEMPENLVSSLSDNGDFQLDVPHDGGDWMGFFDDLSSFAKETEKTPGVVIVANVKGRNRYFKPRKSFS